MCGSVACSAPATVRVKPLPNGSPTSQLPGLPDQPSSSDCQPSTRQSSVPVLTAALASGCPVSALVSVLAKAR